MSKENYEKLIGKALNERPLMLIPTFDGNSPYHEIKVLLPRDIEDDVDSIEVDIRFKEKANCRKKKQTFVDKEGIHYITGFKQEGSRSESEKNEE